MNIIEQALTFDDVLLLPSYSEILPHETSLKTCLTPAISLNIPLLSAAMDTVTEYQLAITIAQQGGIGIIHKNLSIEQQAKQVRQVKKYESGIVTEPVTVSPQATIQEVVELTRRKNISGVPVVEDQKLVGIVTSRDLRFKKDTEGPVKNIMTGKDDLVTVTKGTDKEQIHKLMHRYRIEKVLVVNDGFQLMGLITAKDIQKASEHPDACLDESERLRVGAAIGVGDEGYERAEHLIDSGVDVIIVDTAHGHSKPVIDIVRLLRKSYPNCQIIAGNIVTGEAATALADVGVDAVKVGIGPGSICTTRVISGVGMPQFSALANVKKALAGHGITIISDGGIRYSGDIAKALAAGAHSVMIGGLFAGTEEAPGEVELYQGRAYKSYRGMGSLGAMAEQHGSADRYFQADQEPDKLIPEGIEGRVPYKGGLTSVIHQLTGGIRAAMGYTGSATLETLHKQACFVRLTQAGVKENHVHDVTITKEPPNYRS